MPGLTKKFLIGVLVFAGGSGVLTAQERHYVGMLGGISTLSADGRSVTGPDTAEVSLYKPENGAAFNALGGWILNDYLTVQGNYIWNRNRLRLTSTEVFEGGSRFYEQERTSSLHSVIWDVLLYFRERNDAIRPYLSVGVGFVRFESDQRRTSALQGAFDLPPNRFIATNAALRVAVGIDLRVGNGWALRYSFSESLGRNPISRQLVPPGERNLANFQNLFGFIRYF